MARGNLAERALVIPTVQANASKGKQELMMFDNSHPYQGKSIERWIAGHHLFFVEIQLIVLAIDAYDRTPTPSNLSTVIDLIRGSATSMQLAGNFSRDAYEPVRESMAHLDEDFSGIFSADHRVMIRKLAKLKKTSQADSAVHLDLKDAIEIAYKAHAHVCRRFVGDHGSLANADTIAWKTILNKFMPRTLSKIGFSRQPNAKRNHFNEKDIH